MSITNYIIPPIGSKGQYIFLEPFNTSLYQEQELEVVSVGYIKELEDKKIDVLKVIYNIIGLTNEDYLDDINNNIPIVTFMSSNGSYLYVPADRIQGMPDSSGVKYQERIIAINLGLIPLETDLDSLKENIKDLVYDNFGVTSSIKEVHSSSVVLIDKVKDTAFRKLLENKRTNNLSYRTRYNQLKKQYDDLNNLYTRLEEYAISLKQQLEGN